MAIQHMDNFSLYGVGGQGYLTNGMYAEIGNFSSMQLLDDPDPILTGPVAAMVGGSGWSSVLRLVLSSTQTTVGVANRFWLDSLPSDTSFRPHIVSWRDLSNNEMAYVTVETTGALSAYLNGVLVGTTTTPAITANAWWHIESKCVFNGASSSLEVRVEGITVLNVTGTTTAPCAQVAMSNARGGATTGWWAYWKDYVVWDGTGSLNNNFLGSVQVKSLIPDGDVAANWTRSAGSTNYSLIDEDGPPNDDTDYVYAVTPAPSPDKYSLTNLPIDVTSVKGLMVVQRSRKTDGGDGNVQMGLISGASTQLLTNRPITTAYTYFKDISEVDPVTSGAWLPSAVNNAQLQLNRTV